MPIQENPTDFSLRFLEVKSLHPVLKKNGPGPTLHGGRSRYMPDIRP